MKSNQRSRIKSENGLQFKIPVIPLTSREAQKNLYLLCMAREAAKKNSSGSFVEIEKFRNYLILLGYSYPNHLFSTIKKNQFGLFQISKSKRIYFVSIKRAIAKILEQDYAYSQAQDEWNPIRLTSYIVTVNLGKIESFKVGDFKRLYTGLIASRPSPKPQDNGPLVYAARDRKTKQKSRNYGEETKHYRKIADPQKIEQFRKQEQSQLIDSLPEGRTYRNIGLETSTTKATIVRRIKRTPEIKKINRSKTIRIYVAQRHNVLDCGSSDETILKKNSLQNTKCFIGHIPQSILMGTEDYEQLKRDKEYHRYFSGVPSKIRSKTCTITVYRAGMKTQVKATCIDLERDLSNIYWTPVATIEDAYVVDSTPLSLTASAKQGRKTKIRKGLMQFPLNSCGQMQPLYIRRMNHFERKIAKKQIINPDSAKIDLFSNQKISFLARNPNDFWGWKLPPLLTKHNHLPKNFHIIKKEKQCSI